MLLLCSLLLAYAQPLLAPIKESASAPKKKEETDVSMSHTSLPYGEIQATGFAQFIGQPPAKLTAVYGEPLEIQKTSLGYEWWILGEDEDDYLQISVRHNKVSSIFVLGKELNITPFKMGMTLSAVADLTTIYSNFTFDYQKQQYQFELSEEDMNYRPLIAYDNDTFAILHLNQGTGELIAVRYVDKHTLLSLMPYQLNDGEISQQGYPPETDWTLVNSDRERQLRSILTILRKRDELGPYIYLPELGEVAQRSLSFLRSQPLKILTEPSRVEQLREKEDIPVFNQPFSLSASEFDKMLTNSKIESEGLHGIVYLPSYDVPFLALSWYSATASQEQFTHANEAGVGVAFQENAVLFLFAEENAKLFSHASQESTTTTTTTSTTSLEETSSQEGSPWFIPRKYLTWKIRYENCASNC